MQSVAATRLCADPSPALLPVARPADHRRYAPANHPHSRPVRASGWHQLTARARSLASAATCELGRHPPPAGLLAARATRHSPSPGACATLCRRSWPLAPVPPMPLSAETRRLVHTTHRPRYPVIDRRDRLSLLLARRL